VRGARDGTSQVSEAVSQLAENHRACLRLVARGMSSKEIAKELNLAPQTVDTYIKTTIARLGVSNRREAARHVAEFEQSQKLGSPLASLAEQPRSGELTASPERERRSAGQSQDADKVDASALRAFRDWVRWLLHVPPAGGKKHDLTAIQIIGQATRIAVLCAVIATALISLISGAISLLSR
jgi:DNA-binding CsgD family transcriptional regulator